MMENNDLELFDYSNIIFQLEEKFKDLHSKTKALEESEKELMQICQESYNKDILIDDNKRTIADLQMKLTTANHVVEAIQTEKCKAVHENIQLKINCNNALKERQILIEETLTAKLENVTLKLNIKQLQEKIATLECVKKNMEASFQEMNQQFTQVKNAFQSNVIKLEKEHQYLKKSVETTAEFNKRLHVIGISMQDALVKKNKEMEEWRKEKICNIEANIETSQNIQDSYKHKFDEKAVLERIYLEIEKNNETDKEIESLLAKYGKDY